MDMYSWLNSLMGQYGKKAFPIVTYPAITFSPGKSIQELVKNPVLQAECVINAARNMPSAGACTLMDLSVEAECFGARVRMSDSEVPAVEGVLLTDIEKAAQLKVPEVFSGRAGICVQAVKLIVEQLTDRPLFAGIIGPFSLAGRLTDITEIMYYCYDAPEELSVLLEKCTEFITAYALELKKAGANGILLCEPLAGMLSPSLESDFSAPFVKRIVDAVQDSEFLVIYHNCGNGVALMTESLAANGAAAYHFGNSVSLADMLRKMPPDRAVMGNINPVGVLHDGSPEAVREAVTALCRECAEHDNFVLSTGCDVPPGTPWENIEAFFMK